MHYITSSVFLFLLFKQLTAQVDTVNTTTDVLQTDRLHIGNTSYLVYIEDGERKSNFEVWDRSIHKKDDDYLLTWTRHSGKAGTYYDYAIALDSNLQPLSEKILHYQRNETGTSVEKKHFIYKNGAIFSHSDTAEHNLEAFRLSNLNNSFNWEIDLEILSALPLEEGKQFDISLYHPGSATPPQYYRYRAAGSEIIDWNATEVDCLVVNVEYSNRQYAEFWIDKSTYRVIQMKETFFGKHRYKKLLF